MNTGRLLSKASSLLYQIRFNENSARSTANCTEQESGNILEVKELLSWSKLSVSISKYSDSIEDAAAIKVISFSLLLVLSTLSLIHLMLARWQKISRAVDLWIHPSHGAPKATASSCCAHLALHRQSNVSVLQALMQSRWC